MTQLDASLQPAAAVSASAWRVQACAQRSNGFRNAIAQVIASPADLSAQKPIVDLRFLVSY